MKIISKYKDYYDYLSNIYGVDEKLVLDRREYYTNPYIPFDYSITNLFIGEYTIQGLWMNGKLNFGQDIEKFSNQDRSVYNYSFYNNYNKSDYWVIPNSKYSYQNVYCLKKPKFLGEASPTWKLDCPILEGYYKKSDYTKLNKYPILKDFNVNTIFTPEQVWMYLTEWLSKRITNKENNIQPIPNDVKIVSAGFDLKTSFRK
jgi:hypothetical protein